MVIAVFLQVYKAVAMDRNTMIVRSMAHVIFLSPLITFYNQSDAMVLMHQRTELFQSFLVIGDFYMLLLRNTV